MVSPLNLAFFFWIGIVAILHVDWVRGESDSEDCPPLESIAPCHCDREGLSCFNQLTEETLTSVFQVDFKYLAYRSIWITENPIRRLKANSFNGYRVNQFFIEENQIETIEENAFNGSYSIMQTLSLYKNRISSFPFQELELMSKLTKLSLSTNQLTKIPANSFSLATSLDTVDLSNNLIDEIAPGAFFGMKGLGTILLSSNRLKKIPALAFGSIQRPFQIDLSGNSIISIDPSAFTSSHPIGIDLSDNQLTFLDPNIFELPVKAFGTLLNVEANPFSCKGCSNFRWLLSGSALRSILNFQCTNGRSLKDLNMINIGCLF